jgi:hypothetical protein
MKPRFLLKKETSNLQTYTAPDGTAVNHVEKNEKGYLNHPANWSIWNNVTTLHLLGTGCMTAELSVFA